MKPAVIPFVSVRCAPSKVAKVTATWQRFGPFPEVVFEVQAYQGANAHLVPPNIRHNVSSLPSSTQESLDAAFNEILLAGQVG